MTAYSVLLDASNIAFKRVGSTRAWSFERVERVRDAWLERDPQGRVHAVIDAGVRTALADRDRATRAERDGWLEVAHGDADDVILREADRYAAAIVTKDNYTHARRDYPWLQGCQDRVFWIWTGRDGRLNLRRRPVSVASDAAIDEAIRKKAAKAGLTVDDDRQWRCTAPRGKCDYAGGTIPAGMTRRTGDSWYCRRCQYRAEEILAAPLTTPTRPPSVSVMFGTLLQRELELSPEVVTLGRGGSSRSHVLDVTAGLARQDALEISGEHLRLFLDDDGQPVVVHVPEHNASFLNATIGANGLPADNRLVPGAEYPLVTGDVVLIGPGLVRLVVAADGSD